MQTTECMLDAIAHRGPNGREVRHLAGNVVLGAVRLAMVNSRSPEVLLRSADGHITLAYNGEIYNHAALRASLPAHIRASLSANDGAVIIGLYQQHGLNFLEKLDGMFAFALRDEAKQVLILARDRLGIKPLFWRRNGQIVYFCSELRGVATVAPVSIDANGIREFCQYRFVRAPKTIYRDVFKVEPGSYLVIDAGGSITHHKFWQPMFAEGTSRVDGFAGILKQSIATSAAGDHRMGVWLSGGLDSSSVLAELTAHNLSPLACAVGYDAANGEDELAQAAAVASHMGAPLQICRVNGAEVRHLAAQAAWGADEPIYTSVSVSTWQVARLASQHVRGVLTGDGADEILMGYRYLQPVLAAVKAAGPWTEIYSEQVGWATQALQKSLLEEYSATEPMFPPWVAQLPPMNQVRWFELTSRLADYHLTRVDRLAMAHGLEARVPFLRNGGVDWALGQSWKALMKTNAEKRVLRNVYASRLPAHTISRAKQPFTAPTCRWLRGALHEKLHDLLGSRRYCDDLGFRASGISALRRKFERQPESWREIWGVFALFQWYEQTLACRQP